MLLFENPRRMSLVLILVVALSFISLIKFTIFIAATASIIIGVIGLVSRKDLVTAGKIIFIFILFFLLFWFVSGQKLSTLPFWLVSSLEITSGYSDAMYLKPLPVELFASLSAGITFFCICNILRKEPGVGFLQHIFILLVTFMVFLSWKHGLVRAGHITSYVIFLPVAIGMLMAYTHSRETQSGSSRLLSLLFITVTGLCILTTEQRLPGCMWRQVILWPERMACNIKELYWLSTGNWRECFESLKPNYTLDSNLKQDIAHSVIGSSTVDFINFEQWSLIVNGFNYRPRPVFQGYAVYTDYLQSINLSYYKSNYSPEYLLLNINYIDNRHPMLDDATIMPFILSNYELVFTDIKFLVLKRRLTPLYTSQPKLIKEQTVGFDDIVELHGKPDKILLIQVEMDQTILGKIVKLLYQPPLIMMKIFSKEDILDFRFYPSMARNGFLVNPLVLDNNGLVSLFKGSGRTVYALTFNRPDPSLWQISEKIKIKVYELERVSSAI
jgi:hypothetical protein